MKRKYRIILNEIDYRYKVVDKDDFPFGDSKDIIGCVESSLVEPCEMELEAPTSEENEEKLAEMGVLV